MLNRNRGMVFTINCSYNYKEMRIKKDAVF